VLRALLLPLLLLVLGSICSAAAGSAWAAVAAADDQVPAAGQNAVRCTVRSFCHQACSCRENARETYVMQVLVVHTQQHAEMHS
jgi:hypothetical protein